MSGINLTIDPTKKQHLACVGWADNRVDEICFGGAKYGGKSYLGSALIFADALMYPGTLYFIARYRLNDLRKFTMPTIFEVFKDWGIESAKYIRYNAQDNFFTCYNDSKVYLLEASDQPSDPLFERFGSMQMTRGWIEEGGEIGEEAANALMISTGRWKNDEYKLHRKLLTTCNPKKNWLYRRYFNPSRNGTLPDNMRFIQALPKDNTKGDKSYIDNLNKLTGVAFQRLVAGNWDYEDDPMLLIEYEAIDDLFNNQHVGAGTKYLTADIARFGADHSVIGLWDGFILERIWSFSKASISDVASEIREIMNQLNIPASRVIVDEDGVGGGTKDILRCKGFVNNSRAIEIKDVKENYKNLKSQCYFRLADRINKRGIFIKSKSETVVNLIREDLGQVKMAVSDDDRTLSIISKDEMRQALGRSPDYSDMIMMREWFELQPNNTMKINR